MTSGGLHGRQESLPGDWIDRVFGALSHRSRRMVVSVLLANGPLSVDELAAYLAGVDGAEEREVSTEADHERSLVTLVHVHLPTLERAGLVSWDEEVRLGEHGELAEELIEVVAAYQSPGSDE